MTEPDSVLTVDRDAGVATVVIDRPPANAVNPAMIEEFLQLLPSLVEDDTVRVIVIRGRGRFFIAGADIKVMRDLSFETQVAMRGWVEVQRLIELAPKPVIAALNGFALGGGAELSLACDLRLATESAQIGFPEMELGLFPGAGGSQRLPRLLGPHLAKLIMIEARRFPAREALAIGLVDRVVPDADFETALAEQAARWAALPTRTVGLLKRSIDAAAHLDISSALAHEWQAVLEVIRTEDTAEGLQSFLDKRRPVFRGR